MSDRLTDEQVQELTTVYDVTIKRDGHVHSLMATNVAPISRRVVAADVRALAMEVQQMRTVAIEWFDIQQVSVPADTPILVWLPIPHHGSHVAAGCFFTPGAGSPIGIIGGLNLWDLESQPTHWAYAPVGPNGESA